jgi:GNAT superfamily N-acetyltransferase
MPLIPPISWSRDRFTISTDPAHQDLDCIHGYLRRAYWSMDIPRELVARSMEHSLNFGLFQDTPGAAKQIGFARVVTDYATFAWLGDVFVLEDFRGRGLSKWLLQCVMAHPSLQGLRRFLLATRDAHGLYKQYGFTPLAAPDRMMEVFKPDMYRRQIAGQE